MIAPRDKVAETAPICRIELFGGTRLVMGDRVVERFRTRKSASLLARLALFPDRFHSRDELIALLWPDMEEGAARNNLRQALCYVRSIVESRDGSAGPFIVADRLRV